MSLELAQWDNRFQATFDSKMIIVTRRYARTTLGETLIFLQLRRVLGSKGRDGKYFDSVCNRYFIALRV
jgi:hypothetical protein